MKTIFVLIFLASSAFGQESVKLEVHVKKGDKYTYVSTSSVSGKINGQVGEEKQELSLLQKSLLKVKDEVLEVTGREPAALERKILEGWREEKNPFAEEPVRTKMTLEGKSVTLKKKGEQTVVEGGDGAGGDELKKHRLQLPAFVKGLPKEAVAVGATWDTPERDMLDELSAEAQGVEWTAAKVKAKLSEVSGSNAAKIAIIVYDIEISGKMGESATMKGKAKATARLELATGRLLSIAVEGHVEISGDDANSGAKFTGSLEVKSEQTWTWE
ncbi:MAG: hypothetical protein HY716_06085 [Planctomycetes bacterium]|nr:hypothetical protein [Planctomycetota bacterium]